VQSARCPATASRRESNMSVVLIGALVVVATMFCVVLVSYFN
jgi:hypothetical protein